MPRNSRRTRGGGARCGVWARGRESNTAWIGIAQAEAATDGGCATRARRQRSSNPPFQIPHPAPLRLAMTQQGRVCRTARLALVVCRSRQLPQHQARLLLEVSLPITCLPCVPRCSPLPRRALCLPELTPAPWCALSELPRRQFLRGTQRDRYKGQHYGESQSAANYRFPDPVRMDTFSVLACSDTIKATPDLSTRPSTLRDKFPPAHTDGASILLQTIQDPRPVAATLHVIGVGLVLALASHVETEQHGRAPTIRTRVRPEQEVYRYSLRYEMVEPCTPSSSTIANSTFRKQTGISDVVKIYMLQSAAQLNSVTDSRADGVEYCLTHEKSALAALIYVNRTQPPPPQKKKTLQANTPYIL